MEIEVPKAYRDWLAHDATRFVTKEAREQMRAVFQELLSAARYSSDATIVRLAARWEFLNELVELTTTGGTNGQRNTESR